MSKPIISLSTSYLQSKFKNNGYAMLQEAAAMGFDYVELGHSTSMNSVEGILRAIEEGVVKVSSLHNFCPLPPFAKGAAPNLFSPATKSSLESEQWLRHTKNTLEFAKQTGAKAVVCHTGELPYFFYNPSAKILKYRDNLDDNFEMDKLADDKNYLAVRDNFLKRSQKNSLQGYKNIIENFTKLFDDEEIKNGDILCGVENRDNPQELPMDASFEVFAEMTTPLPRLKLWHDVGHSKRKEQLQLTKMLDLIERTRQYIIGWHLHDCSKVGKDHIAIGKGDINFAEISKFFEPQKHIFTIELNSAVERADAIDSLKRVQDIIG